MSGTEAVGGRCGVHWLCRACDVVEALARERGGAPEEEQQQQARARLVSHASGFEILGWIWPRNVGIATMLREMLCTPPP
eukprot:705580-Rhodomonas_salina.3